MKRLIAGMLVLGLLALVLAVPAPAEARQRGHFWGGVAVGAVTGLVLGGVLAPRVYYSEPAVVYQPAPVYVQPAPVYVQPQPVYVSPSPPVCMDYWVGDHWRGGVWVQGHWERVCR